MLQILTDNRLGLGLAILAILGVAVTLYRRQAITLPGCLAACLITLLVGGGLILTLG